MQLPLSQSVSRVHGIDKPSTPRESFRRCEPCGLIMATLVGYNFIRKGVRGIVINLVIQSGFSVDEVQPLLNQSLSYSHA